MEEGPKQEKKGKKRDELGALRHGPGRDEQ